MTDIESIWQHMTRGRYIELSKSGEALTEEEAKDWHYCYDWDFMLIHRSDPTFEGCHCGFKEGTHLGRSRTEASKKD